MPRSIHNAALETRTARLKLPVASKPVWTKVGDGLGLGYRRNKLAGTWVARIANGTGGHTTKNVATADDYAEADSKTVLTYWQAQEKAKQLGRGEATPREAIITLAGALDRYEADLRTRGADPGNVSRLRHNLTPALLKTAVLLLSAADLRRWRDSLVKRLAPATVNRVTTAAKAALNLKP